MSEACIWRSQHAMYRHACKYLGWPCRLAYRREVLSQDLLLFHGSSVLWDAWTQPLEMAQLSGYTTSCRSDSGRSPLCKE